MINNNDNNMCIYIYIYIYNWLQIASITKHHAEHDALRLFGSRSLLSLPLLLATLLAHQNTHSWYKFERYSSVSMHSPCTGGCACMPCRFIEAVSCARTYQNSRTSSHDAPCRCNCVTPKFPTKIIPANIAWLKLSLWTREFHPLKLRLCVSQTPWNPES